MSLTELAEAIGLTLANVSILETGKARAIRLSTLDALCTVLRCQPGDLLVHEAGFAGDAAELSSTDDGPEL